MKKIRKRNGILIYYILFVVAVMTSTSILPFNTDENFIDNSEKLIKDDNPELSVNELDYDIEIVNGSFTLTCRKQTNDWRYDYYISFVIRNSGLKNISEPIHILLFDSRALENVMNINYLLNHTGLPDDEVRIDMLINLTYIGRHLFTVQIIALEYEINLSNNYRSGQITVGACLYPPGYHRDCIGCADDACFEKEFP